MSGSKQEEDHHSFLFTCYSVAPILIHQITRLRSLLSVLVNLLCWYVMFLPMYAISHLAFICTDLAPKGTQPLSIQLSTLGSILIGLLVYILVIYIAKTRIKQKGWRLFAYLALTSVFIAGLILIAFFYSLSTCGT